MGCGNSKPGAEAGAPIPEALNPLRRRYEEMKRNRKRSKSTLSAKQLLDYESTIAEDDDRMTIKSMVGENEEKGKPIEKVEKHQVLPVVIEAGKEYDGIVLELVDSESAFGDGDSSEIAPGSPSFREYCTDLGDNSSSIYPGDNSTSIESVDSCDITKGDSGKDVEKVLEKNRRKKNTSMESINTEGSVVVLVKKESKRRRSFKMVLPKGKPPMAVMNLLNMKSCMSIPCSTPQPNSRLASATPI